MTDYFVIEMFQTCLSELIIPHLGDSITRSWDRFPSTLWYCFNPRSTSIPPSSWKIILSENPITENIHPQGKLRNYHCQNRRKARESKFLFCAAMKSYNRVLESKHQEWKRFYNVAQIFITFWNGGNYYYKHVLRKYFFIHFFYVGLFIYEVSYSSGC